MPPLPRPEHGEILVILRAVDEAAPLPPADAAALTPADRAKAARFAFAQDRARFLAARALLRRAVAEALGADPATITLDTLPGGKPVLPGAGLAFSASRTEGLAAVALARGDRGLGLDVEARGRFARLGGLARRLHPDERRFIAAAPSAPRLARVWTRKEAALKADGRGLDADLAAFSALPPGPGWARIRGVCTGQAHVGALAAAGDAALPPLRLVWLDPAQAV